MLIYQYGYGAEIIAFKESVSTSILLICVGGWQTASDLKFKSWTPYELSYQASRITKEVAYSIDRVDQDRYD